MKRVAKLAGQWQRGLEEVTPPHVQNKYVISLYLETSWHLYRDVRKLVQHLQHHES